MTNEFPRVTELADDLDELDGCDIPFDDPVDGDELLEIVLLGDSLPGTIEALEKLAFYAALREAADAPPDQAG